MGKSDAMTFPPIGDPLSLRGMYCIECVYEKYHNPKRSPLWEGMSGQASCARAGIAIRHGGFALPRWQSSPSIFHAKPEKRRLRPLFPCAGDDPMPYSLHAIHLMTLNGNHVINSKQADGKVWKVVEVWHSPSGFKKDDATSKGFFPLEVVDYNFDAPERELQKRLGQHYTLSSLSTSITSRFHKDWKLTIELPDFVLP